MRGEVKAGGGGITASVNCQYTGMIGRAVYQVGGRYVIEGILCKPDLRAVELEVVTDDTGIAGIGLGHQFHVVNIPPVDVVTVFAMSIKTDFESCAGSILGYVNGISCVGYIIAGAVVIRKYRMPCSTIIYFSRHLFEGSCSVIIQVNIIL